MTSFIYLAGIASGTQAAVVFAQFAFIIEYFVLVTLSLNITFTSGTSTYKNFMYIDWEKKETA